MDERRRVSQRQEKNVARAFGAKQHGGSGSGWSKRHDGHTDDLLLECKTVLGGKRQITIKADDLLSVERTALIEGRTPVLNLELAGRRYVCLTEEDFIEHRHELREARQRGRAASEEEPPP